MSYSPGTGLVYLPVQELPAFFFATDPAFTVRPGLWNDGIATGPPLPDDAGIRAAVKAATTGVLLAWDPVAQKEVWRAEGRGPSNGGTLATAGGLVFQGTVDGRFLAMDAATGQELWSYNNQAATQAGPISYEVDGEQYVAVLGGYGSVLFVILGFVSPAEGALINGRVNVFKLGGNAPKPVIDLRRIPIPRPPEITMTPEEDARGAAGYGRYCQVCHGIAAISGNVLPDLRRSPKLQDAAAWRKVVVEGETAALGMPRFDRYIDPAAAELIRGYVARQAGLAWAAEQEPGKR
jgi:hypothetical protein